MEHVHERRIVRPLLVGWSVVFFLYALLGTWLGTGPDALAGPSTLKDNILAGIWLGFGIAQLVLAILLNKQYKPWLFWLAATFAVLSVSMVFGPLLFLLVAK